MTQQSPLGALDSLPREILVQVLEYAPDVRSLWETALTCRTLYAIITDSTLQLPSRVITRRIDAQVLDLAFTAADVGSRNGWLLSWLPNKRRVTRADIDQGLNTKPPPSAWSIRLLLAMDEMHDAVNEIIQSLTTTQPLADKLKHTPMSRSESCRFQNAFYRAQIFCAMQQVQPIRYYWQRHLARNFVMRYNAMESEQVACVWDMLREEVRKAIYRICSCDPAWAHYMHDMQFDAVSDAQLEFYALKGFVFMRNLMRASQRDELIEMLGPDPRKARVEVRLSNVLADSVVINSEDVFIDAVEFEYDEHFQDYVQKALINDTDEGPRAMWRWAHTQDGMVYLARHHMLRREGYVLWDHARCDETWLRTTLTPTGLDWSSDIAWWEIDEKEADRRNLESARLRLGWGTLTRDEVVDMINRNVLEYEGYQMKVQLSSAS